MAFAERVDLLARAIEFAQDRMGPTNEDGAERVRLEAAAAAREQRPSDRGFELGQELGGRRLREPERCRRQVQLALPLDRIE